MFEDLKKRPLLGLALAIAGGLILAHMVNEATDYLWLNFLSDFLSNNAWMLADLTVAAGLLALIVWRRRGILAWLGRHKRGVGLSVFAVFLLCFALALVGLSNAARAAREQQAAEAQNQERAVENQRLYSEFMKNHPGSKETVLDFILDSEQKTSQYQIQQGIKDGTYQK